jgi:hypothetical protein
LPELTELSKFKTAFRNKEVVKFEGIDLFVISFADLIKDKESNARPQDLEDIRHLKKRRKFE